ncbi:hypothetical protein D3C87_513400 [compost metagenome]
MKLLLKGILTLFLTHLGSFAFAQEQITNYQLSSDQDITDKLVYVYGNEFLAQNPDLITVYGKILSERVEYIATPHTSDEKYPHLSSVPLMTKNNPTIQGADFSNFTISTFNPLVYQIDYFSDKTLVYRIDDTDYILVVRPIKRN